MTKTYAQLMKQIESLQADAERIRRKELDGVITRIREAIDAYKLTAADLGLSSSAAPKASAGMDKAPGKRRGRKPGPAKGAKFVKYANGMGGTWGGLGKRPQWLRDAINSGKSLQDFLVK
jgi:DNA-binding protein H-NS